MSDDKIYGSMVVYNKSGGRKEGFMGWDGLSRVLGVARCRTNALDMNWEIRRNGVLMAYSDRKKTHQAKVEGKDE